MNEISESDRAAIESLQHLRSLSPKERGYLLSISRANQIAELRRVAAAQEMNDMVEAMDSELKRRAVSEPMKPKH